MCLEKKLKMDMNARHSLLREKLDKLGFTQPLPIASIALVSSLLDDLLLANNKLAETQKCAAKLEKVCCQNGKINKIFF